jgi:hypothetical protein
MVSVVVILFGLSFQISVVAQNNQNNEYDPNPCNNPRYAKDNNRCNPRNAILANDMKNALRTDPSNNRKYIEGASAGIKCKIYVDPNPNLQGGYEVGGLDCGGKDVTSKCAAINPNYITEMGGSGAIQLNCEPSWFAFKDSDGGVVFWSFNNGDTYAIKDQNGNILTMSLEQVRKVCEPFISKAGPGESILCPGHKSLDDFKRAVKQFVCRDAGPGMLGICKNFGVDNIVQTPDKITGDQSRAKASSDSDKQADPVRDGATWFFFNLVKNLLSFVSALLLILLYLLGWLAIGLMWLVSNAFLAFIQINPAGQGFVDVALEPWKIVYGLANLIILGSFLYVGFSYILGKKGNKIEDFITNIIIITVALNFTFFASATVVNITHGIGNLFVTSYTYQRGGKIGDIIGALIRSIEQVSIIRCNNLRLTSTDQNSSSSATSSSTTTNASSAPSSNTTQSSECDNNIGGQMVRLLANAAVGISIPFGGFYFLSEWSGEPIAAMAGELAFLVIMGWAIYVMFRATFAALYRVVAIWLLMITSPFALAAYFSPIPDLKKSVADKWVSKFVYFCLFYPAFILGLILVSTMSDVFARVARDSLFTSAVSGVSAYALEDSQLIGIIIGLIVTALVTVGALQYLIGFLEKELGKITEIALDYTKKALAVTGGIVGGVGSAVGFSTRQLSKLGNPRLKKIDTQLEKAKEELSRNPSAERRQKINQQIERLKKERGEILERQTWIRNFGRGFDNNITKLGNFIRVSPAYVETIFGLPKKYLDNLDRGLQADYAYAKTELAGRLEAIAKTTPWIGKLLKSVGYDFAASKDAIFNAQTREELEEEARQAGMSLDQYLKAQIHNAARNARIQSLGVQLRPAAFAVQASLFNQILGRAINSLNDLGDKDFDRIMEILGNALNDDSGSLASQIFSSRRNRDLVRQAIQNNIITNPEIMDKIRTRLPNLLPETEQTIIGRELATDPQAARKVFSIAYSTSNVLTEAYINAAREAGKSWKDIESVIGRGPARGYSRVGLGVAQRNFQGSDFFRSQSAKAVNAGVNETDFQRNVDFMTDRVVNQGMTDIPQNILISVRDLLEGQRRSGSISRSDYETKAREVFNRVYSTEFGEEIGQAMLNGDLNQALQKVAEADYNTLANTKLGEKISSSPVFTNLNNEEQREAYLRATYAQVLHVANQNRLEDGSNAFLTEIRNTLEKATAANVKIDQKTGLARQEITALEEVIRNIQTAPNQAKEILETNQRLKESLGRAELYKRIENAIRQGGSVEVPLVGGRTTRIDFSNINPEDGLKVLGDLNQLLAMTGNDDYHNTARNRLLDLANSFQASNPQLASMLTLLGRGEESIQSIGNSLVQDILQRSIPVADPASSTSNQNTNQANSVNRPNINYGLLQQILGDMLRSRHDQQTSVVRDEFSRVFGDNTERTVDVLRNYRSPIPPT